MMIEPTIQQIRASAVESGMRPATLARAAGLHPNTLRGMFGTDWNPRADTLQKLADFVNSGSAPTVSAAPKFRVPRART